MGTQLGGLSDDLLLCVFDAALVRRLIDAGESPDASDGLPMTLALAENHLEVVKVLNDAMVPILNKRLRSRHE